MRGDVVNLNIKAFNKRCSGLIVKCLEIPHYAYSSRSLYYLVLKPQLLFSHYRLCIAQVWIKYG